MHTLVKYMMLTYAYVGNSGLHNCDVNFSYSDVSISFIKIKGSGLHLVFLFRVDQVILFDPLKTGLVI